MTINYVRAGAGPAAWVAGDTYTFKATTESTGGAFALLEASIPPGGGPPPHVHTKEDEAFYLLDGVLEITVGEEKHLVRGGDFIFLPREIVHCFTNPSVNAARALILITPGGFEKFFAEAGIPARQGEQSPPFNPDDLERLAGLSEQHGARIQI
ncbi:cupin domain-containing protein [Streptomyces sp. NPDC087263]|uniref:cupin domain-containing protein n=1 Tax=Streptomyces sp. NPDC087263 TaxID=3365773 RepID=UPI0037F95296